MKKLIIAEKREAVENLIKSGVLGQGFSRTGETYENDKYIIVYCLGHLYGLMKVSEVNPDYGFKFAYQPDFNYKMPNLKNEVKFVANLTPMSKTDTLPQYREKVLKNMDKMFARKDYDEIILAADADDEGERIHTDPIKYTKVSLPKDIKITRFWNTGAYNSNAAVQKAMNERKPITDIKYTNLLSTTMARTLSDYLVGMTMTKLFTDKTQALFRCGRVLSVLIGMIGRRENEVNNFVPKDYWTIKGLIKNNSNPIDLNHFYNDVTIDESGKEVKSKATKYFIEEEVNEILDKIKNANYTGVVESYVKRKSSSRKPKLYSTDEFNTEFMELHKMTLAQSNAHLEWLRNNGYSTYPRTNGNYFSDTELSIFNDALDAAKTHFKDKIEDIKKVDSAFKIDALTTSNPVFNNAKAAKQNHTPLTILKALTPSDINKFNTHPEHGDGNKKVKLTKLKEAFELLAMRCLIQVLPDDILAKETLIVDVAGYKFESNAEIIEYLGWKKFDDNAKTKSEKTLNFNGKDGDSIKLDEVSTKTEKTRPPLIYTEKTLLKAMMFPNEALTEEFNNIVDPNEKKAKMGRFKDIKKTLTTSNGIGTQATRETIFDKLKKDEVIKIVKNDIFLTDNGKYQFDLLPTYLKSLETTAIWEQKLDDIRTGNFTYNEFMDMLSKEISDIVDDVNSQNIKVNYNVKSNNKSSGGKDVAPTSSQLKLVELISKVLNIKVEDNVKKSMSNVSKFIDENKDAAFKKMNESNKGGSNKNVTPDGKIILSEKQIDYIMKNENSNDEIKGFAAKKEITSEEYSKIESFFKNQKFNISDKQLNVLKHPNNAKFITKEVKVIIDKEGKNLSKDEQKLVFETIDKIFSKKK